MTELTYMLRGTERAVTVVEGAVAAFPVDARAAWARPRLVAARLATSGAEGLAAGARLAFERAGWGFVVPESEAMTEAARLARRLGSLELRQIVRADNGELMVDTGLATVGVDPNMGDAEVMAELDACGLRLTRRLGIGTGLFEVRVAADRATFDHIGEVRQDAQRSFEFIEPAMLQVIGPRHRPTDPLYPQQWHHRNDGSSGGLEGADVRSEPAWDVTRGMDASDRPVRIAVIDNGFDLSHSDLQDAWYSGGHFADVGGGASKFVRRGEGVWFPDASHGTFCAGMIGARSGNGAGGCGIAPACSLIPVACLPDQIGTQNTLALSLLYAALPRLVDPGATLDGADIVVCSLGPNGAQWLMTSALDLAIDRVVTQGRGGVGTPIFWAVSNGNYDIAADEVSSDPRIIGVGRSNHFDREDGTAWGEELAFLAPGAEVFSTTSGGGYNYSTGTSYAAPLAAGIAGLALARHPTLDPAQLRAHLLASCDQVGPLAYSNGRNNRYGHGRINAFKAVH
jgi:hypothetical protein